MFRLNSRMPFPIDAPISGTRRATKSTSTMTRRISISLKPKFPKLISSLLEERTRDQVRDEDTDEAEERHIEGNRPNSELEDNEVDVQWSELGRHSGRQELLDGPGWQEAPGYLSERPADHESYTKYQGVKPRTVLRRS